MATSSTSSGDASSLVTVPSSSYLREEEEDAVIQADIAEYRKSQDEFSKMNCIFIQLMHEYFKLIEGCTSPELDLKLELEFRRKFDKFEKEIFGRWKEAVAEFEKAITEFEEKKKVDYYDAKKKYTAEMLKYKKEADKWNEEEVEKWNKEAEKRNKEAEMDGQCTEIIKWNDTLRKQNALHSC